MKIIIFCLILVLTQSVIPNCAWPLTPRTDTDCEICYYGFELVNGICPICKEGFKMIGSICTDFGFEQGSQYKQSITQIPTSNYGGG